MILFSFNFLKKKDPNNNFFGWWGLTCCGLHWRGYGVTMVLIQLFLLNQKASPANKGWPFSSTGEKCETDHLNAVFMVRKLLYKTERGFWWYWWWAPVWFWLSHPFISTSLFYSVWYSVHGYSYGWAYSRLTRFNSKQWVKMVSSHSALQVPFRGHWVHV